MKRRILGQAYLVEPGVVATLRGFARSTGLSGNKFAAFNIVEGIDHLLPVTSDLVPTSELSEEVRGRYRLGGVDFVAVTIRKPEWFRGFPTVAW